ncbi:MAG: twin-arginine translocase TatA/TatE family subunit [Bacteroidota bacterium]
MVTNSVLLGILGGQEIILILIIVLVLFGGKKIPELMRGLGRGVNEYNKAKNEVLDNLNDNAQAKDNTSEKGNGTK